MAPGTIHIPAITAQYRNFAIHVEPITLEPGEILGIFGKSGSGKTSYLKKIREHFSAVQVHYMSQYDALLEECTIRQNIELGLACSEKDPKTFDGWEHTYRDILKEFEVNRFLPKLPRQLSGGQRKRTEIVRCLMMDPTILLLDEPFQGIGHIFEAVTTKYILERTKRKHGATIIVSHDFDLLCKFSKRVLLVDDQGVIEFVPTQKPDWKPATLRTAWTLGVENVLPASFVNELDPRLKTRENSYVSFWAWMGRWDTDAKHAHTMEFRIPRARIAHTRTYLVHGTIYTEVHVTSQASPTPVLLVGQGEVDPSSEHIHMIIRDSWVLTA